MVIIHSPFCVSTAFAYLPQNVFSRGKVPPQEREE